MSGYVLRPRAEGDLSEIFDYTIERWGPGQAEAYLRAIEAAFERIAHDPELGRPVELREGYRRYPSGSHVIFYRVFPEAVEVSRVLHKSMDFGRHI